MSATEHRGDIVFLYRVEPGPASQSYGIQVAKLAGVPRAVLTQARQKLASFEQAAIDPLQPDLFSPGSQNGLNDAQREVIAQLEQLDADALTPRQALALLYELADELKT